MSKEVEEAAREFIANKPNARASKALRAILERGTVTTRELNKIGYDHPPRAIADAVDNGIPIKKEMIKADDGKRMARYSLGEPGQLRGGQAGRANFSKAFKTKIVKHYGEVDTITGWEVSGRTLQIDHRVPYRVGGDAGMKEQDVGSFMLLSGSSQRAKSFSCENCENWTTIHDEAICRTCYWAFPEAYTHVAMREVRRADVVWQDGETKQFDALNKLAHEQGTTVSQLVKDAAKKLLD
ncbi:hypothetical protein [Novosphingobium clariflavum]|uniref:HNH endonuclease n=1 Tax=Novosphingobium clariflavum TaxID=2029884 RepID=A0ABV6S2G4_9SPHN|nr:hypothetical protein [Novosphingobium clariflavum]